MRVHEAHVVVPHSEGRSTSQSTQVLGWAVHLPHVNKRILELSSLSLEFFEHELKGVWGVSVTKSTV